jgi:hypothetical protein
MDYPLSGFAASPKGDDAIAAKRLLLGVSGLGCALCGLCQQVGGCDAIDS